MRYPIATRNLTDVASDYIYEATMKLNSIKINARDLLTQLLVGQFNLKFLPSLN